MEFSRTMPTENNIDITSEQTARLMTRASHASVAVGSSLVLIKMVAFLYTGSVAMLTSLIDSSIDVIASLINLFAVRQSLVPADQEHRFGHGKIESLAGILQAAFISASVIFIVIEAINKLVHPSPVTHGALGIAVMIISMIVTILLVMYQRYVIKKTGSVVISADSLHYVSDLAFNASVIVAIVLSYYFNLTYADPVIALIIAGFILMSVKEIAKTCIDQLMDRELPDEDRDKIKEIVVSHPDVQGIHGYRTRASGRDIFIQLHLELDPDLKLRRAHNIADEVQEQICQAYPNADVIIHQDPEDDQ